MAEPPAGAGPPARHRPRGGDTIIIGQQINSSSDPMTDDYGRTRQ
jgi:hypothetical protein